VLNRALAYAIAFPHVACIACEHVPGDHRPVVAAASAPPADPFVGPVHMRAGVSRPHAPAGEEGPAPPVGPLPPANPRGLEPESDSVLRLEALPVVNVPPVTEWSEAPPPLPSAPPGPFTTHQLIPEPMQVRLREFRIAVHACMEAARRGRWRWARVTVPLPCMPLCLSAYCPPHVVTCGTSRRRMDCGTRSSHRAGPTARLTASWR
jgi:hypothetical protein